MFQKGQDIKVSLEGEVTMATIIGVRQRDEGLEGVELVVLLNNSFGKPIIAYAYPISDNIRLTE